MAFQSLLLQQLNEKMKRIALLKNIAQPPNGWICSIRTSLGMSLQQLGNKLNISKQAVRNMESREKEGSITLRSLKQLGNAMDMELVYGFVPKDGSLEALIDRKATELATQIVMRTANTMQLENQTNSSQKITTAIKERAAEIKNKTPKILWD